MNKPLDVLAKELKQEIDKIEKMRIDLPEELFMKSCMVQDIKKKYQQYYDEFWADQDDTPDSNIQRYDGKNPRDFGDLTQL